MSNCLTISELVDSPRSPVDAVVVVALAGVAPVEHEDAAVGAIAQVDAAEPGVRGEVDVRLVAADVSAPAPFQPLDVEPPAVEIEGEELAAVRLGPLVGEVDHQSAVRVAAAEAVVFGPGGGTVVQLPRVVPVVMIGVLVDRLVDVRVRLDRVRAHEVGAGDQVPEVAVDRVDEEPLAERVPVVAPGIGRAVGEHLEPLPQGMIAPEAAADGDALALRACPAGRPAPATRPRTGRTASRRAPTAGRWPGCDGSLPPG